MCVRRKQKRNEEFVNDILKIANGMIKEEDNAE